MYVYVLCICIYIYIYTHTHPYMPEVKIGELERGCFTGAGKLDQCMLTFRTSCELDVAGPFKTALNGGSFSLDVLCSIWHGVWVASPLR